MLYLFGFVPIGAQLVGTTDCNRTHTPGRVFPVLRDLRVKSLR